MLARCAVLPLTLCLLAAEAPAQVPARNRLNDAAINAAIGGVVGAAWAAMEAADASMREARRSDRTVAATKLPATAR